MATNPPKMGSIINEEVARDAIHMAVAPVVAAEDLRPGMHVYLTSYGEAVHSIEVGESPVGIVDPFLRRPVRKGQQFWLLLYPNTVTSLRHEWEHPAWPSK